MGIWDKLVNAVRGSYDEDDDYLDDDYYDDDEEGTSGSTASRKNNRNDYDDEVEDDRRRPSYSNNKVTSIKQASGKKNSGTMEVCVIKPTSFDDSREITDTLLSERTVVLNLEGVDSDIAQRILDYTVGSCVALNGNFNKISRLIFIVTPHSTGISGDIQENISNLLAGSAGVQQVPTQVPYNNPYNNY